jgi:hypothetical protein
MLGARIPGTQDPRLAVAALHRSFSTSATGEERLTIPRDLALEVWSATARFAEFSDSTERERAKLGRLLRLGGPG